MSIVRSSLLSLALLCVAAVSMPAAANNTGSLRYTIGASARLPIATGTVGAVDAVGTQLSVDVLHQLERMSASGGYAIRTGATCQSGATGVLTLKAIEHRTRHATDTVMVTENTYGLNGRVDRGTAASTTYSYGASRSASKVDMKLKKSVAATEVVREDTVDLAWELVDCSGNTVFDEWDQAVVRSAGVADDAVEARRRADESAAGGRLADAGAERTLRRFQVVGITVDRRFYDAGSPMFASAARLVKKDEDWDAARQLWEEETYSTDARLRARAHYNLALYFEAAGALDRAVESADASVSEWQTRLAVDLRNSLEARRARYRRMN